VKTAPFLPQGLFRSADVQTLCAAAPLFNQVPASERVRLPLPAGGALVGQASWQPGRARAVLLVHGVGGSSEANYVRRTAATFFRAGFHVLRLNLRGAGEGLTESALLYHGGLTQDLFVALDFLGADARVEGVLLMGFSLGGNTSLKAASEAGAGQRAAPALRAVATVSAPLELSSTSRHLESWRTLPYRQHILRSLLQTTRAYLRLHPEQRAFDPQVLGTLRTIWDYDDRVIAPMHGFGRAEAYYADASSGPRLGTIQVPTLVIHAEDDPMVPAGRSVRPYLDAAQAPVEARWAAHGGHVGFVEGPRRAAWEQSWFASEALAFAERVFPALPK
jgi:hypothetical protein